MTSPITKRTALRLAAVATTLGTLTLAPMSAAATQGTHAEDGVTICHVTNSATNPYVVITVDDSAFDGAGENDHTHHVSKDGRRDVPFVEGKCGGDGGGLG